MLSVEGTALSILLPPSSPPLPLLPCPPSPCPRLPVSTRTASPQVMGGIQGLNRLRRTLAFTLLTWAATLQVWGGGRGAGSEGAFNVGALAPAY